MVDFTKYGLPNPPANQDNLHPWHAEVLGIILQKLANLEAGQKNFENVQTWARISLSICSVMTVGLGLILLFTKVLGG